MHEIGFDVRSASTAPMPPLIDSPNRGAKTAPVVTAPLAPAPVPAPAPAPPAKGARR